MLSDDLRKRVNAYADREWPHDETLGHDVCSARAVRRLTFRQGVEWAMSHTTDEDLPLSAEVARLRSVLRALADHGLRFDLSPTLRVTTGDAVYSQWAAYARRMDESVREHASRALAHEPGDPS